jgi:hypothetical protein
MNNLNPQQFTVALDAVHHEDYGVHDPAVDPPERTAHIERLAGRYRAGLHVDPIHVHDEGDGTWNLVDGWHRTQAALKAGKKQINAREWRMP